jgi:hypothetical protein
MPFFRMVDPEHPLPLATVIWFGSLEFMSLGYGYDMILLLPSHPTDGDHKLSQLGGCCAGTIALVGPAQSGDGKPSIATTIASQGVTTFPNPAPLS